MCFSFLAVVVGNRGKVTKGDVSRLALVQKVERVDQIVRGMQSQTLSHRFKLSLDVQLLLRPTSVPNEKDLVNRCTDLFQRMRHFMVDLHPRSLTDGFYSCGISLTRSLRY